jgi:hypothetical protein
LAKLSNKILLLTLPLALGLIFRIDQYLDARDLMIDEANLVRNLLEKSYVQLLTPLDYEQFAPVGYLFLQKTFTLLGPADELTLRFLPFLIGIATLLLFAYMLRRTTGTFAAIWPLLAFSAGGLLLRYSVEIKQYGLDALIALALIALTQRYWKTPNTSNQILLTYAGAFAIFCAMPAYFILAAAGLILWIDAIRTRQFTPTLHITVPWALAGAFNYLAFLRPGLQNDYLNTYHQAWFLGSPDAQPLTLINALIDSSTGHTAIAWIGGWLLTIAGATYLLRHNRRLGLLITLSIAAPFAASLFEIYTVIPRVILYTFPLVLWLQAYAFRFLREKYPAPAVYTLIIWCLLILPSFGKWEWLPGKMTVDSFKTPLNYLATHATTDTTYVHHHAIPGVKFYTQHHPAKNTWQDIPLVYGHWQDFHNGQFLNIVPEKCRYLLIVHMGTREKRQLINETLAAHQPKIVWENEQGDAILYFP